MKKRIILIVVVFILLIAAISSGWVYNIIRSNKANELMTLENSFRQQYGQDAVITDLVSPEKVYAAAWTSSDGHNNISWNIGGVWVTVYSVEKESE